MKKVLSVVAVAAMAFSFASCKKCTNCEYKYDVLGTEYTYTYDEVCGKKSEVNEFITACETSAESVGGSCTCS